MIINLYVLPTSLNTEEFEKYLCGFSVKHHARYRVFIVYIYLGHTYLN